MAADFRVEKCQIVVEYQDGAQGRNRTTDTAIFSRMLYQLSYLGILVAGGIAQRRGGINPTRARFDHPVRALRGAVQGSSLLAGASSSSSTGLPGST